MKTRDEYDNTWRDHRPGRPTNWRGPHHGTPNPAYTTLCAETDRLGLTLTLDVRDGKPKSAKTHQPTNGREGCYRDLSRLAARTRTGQVVAAVEVTHAGTLTAAAELLHETLKQAA